MKKRRRQTAKVTSQSHRLSPVDEMLACCRRIETLGSLLAASDGTQSDGTLEPQLRACAGLMIVEEILALRQWLRQGPQP